MIVKKLFKFNFVTKRYAPFVTKSKERKMNNIIEIKNLTKEYKKVKAIDNLSFEVKEGEILGLLRTKWKWKINNNKLYIIIIKL